MLKNHLLKQILLSLKFLPTNSQWIMIEALVELLLVDQDAVLLIDGYAGTGKTSVVSAFVNTLDHFNIINVLLAPTGRSAKVLNHYSQKKAFTIHGKIYRQSSSGHFEMDRNLLSNALFIVDEASLISAQYRGSIFGSGDLFDDLITYVFNGHRCKLILLGDSAQLPPIGETISKALNVKQFEAYPVETAAVFLDEIVRQQTTSGIIFNASALRAQMNAESIVTPFLKSFSDVIRVRGDELIDTINDAYHSEGEEQVIVITTSNKRALQYSMGVRNQVLYRESELEVGDRLMIVKNNYFWTKEMENLPFLANGEAVQVIRIKKYHEMYGFRFVDVTLKLESEEEIEARINLESLLSESLALTEKQMQALIDSLVEDYDLKSQSALKKTLRTDPFFNALQVKFAYAITAHKAQGGQWNIVFVDYALYNQEQLNKEYMKWLYTAITRAIKKVYLVNFPSHFFLQEEHSMFQ